MKACEIKKNVPFVRLYIDKAISLIDKQKEFILHLLVAEQSTRNCPFQKHSATQKLNWTGSIIDWVEFVYSLHGVACFNNGKITLTDLFTIMGEIFDIEVRKFSRSFIDIKNRSKGNYSVFIDKKK